MPDGGLRAYNRPLAALTLPILVENALRTLMGSVNVFLLSNWSDEAVAAVGVANQFITMCTLILSLAAGGAAVVISQCLGAGNAERAKGACVVALAISLVSGLAVSLALAIFADRIITLLNLEAHLAKDAALYLRIVGGALFLQGLIATFSAICRSHGRAALPMVAIIAMNVMNLIGAALAVYRPIAPGLAGLPGVAWSYVVSSLAALSLITALTMRLKLGLSIKRLWPVPKRLIYEILRIGSAPGIEALNYNIAQILVTGVVSGLGLAALSGRTYMLSVVGYVYLVGMSIGQASQLLIARMVGARDLDMADKLIARNRFIIIGSNLFFSLLVLTLWRPIFGSFTQDGAVLGAIFPALCFDVALQMGRGTGHNFNNALRAVGDVKIYSIAMMISIWLIQLPMVYLLSKIGALAGIWAAMAIDELVRGNFARFRWMSSKWKKRFLTEA